MKRFLFTLLKGLGILLLGLAVFALYNYYQGRHYSIQSTAASTELELATSTDFDGLARLLVEQMTFEEKVEQLYGESRFSVIRKLVASALIHERFPHVYVGANERLNIPPWVLSDGPRGARVLAPEIDAVTTFPVGMARGASWDPQLEYDIHTVIGKEIRANGANYAATPCINLLRHPGWGRAQETYGEDPWHMGALGVAAVRGLEDQHIMACPKHFALNSVENSRWVIDVKVDERTLREVYLPHFKRVVQQGKPASIMSAYNMVNGEFCGESRKLLTDILRNDWGFNGFVSTDWAFGLYDGVKGINAGLHVEMPMQQAYTLEALKTGIENGEITQTQIDTLVRQSLRTRLPYALVPEQHQHNQDEILNPQHIALAKRAAEESMVLLKNENVLPFGKTSGKTIAVIGRLADVENTGDHGSSDSNPPYVVTPFQGIKSIHEGLGNTVLHDDGSDLESAMALARRADEVILVVGYTHEDEGEYIILQREKMLESAEAGKLIGEKGMGGDREDLRLLADDERLLETVLAVNDKTVVTYIGGSAIDMKAWHDQAPAIVFMWYAGMEGGNALASLLYGDKNFSGKLPFSIAVNVEDYPPFNPYTTSTTYGYYHGYTLFDKENKNVLYPFGFGESYTSFELSETSVVSMDSTASDSIRVSFTLTNTGDKSGAEVVQLYVGFSNSAVDRPKKLLRAFKKYTLAPGTSLSAKLAVATEDLRWYNPSTKQWELEEMEYDLQLGFSSSLDDLTGVGTVELLE